MDPNQTRRDLDAALADGSDEEQIAVLVGALRRWLVRGGFAPDDLRPLAPLPRDPHLAASVGRINATFKLIKLRAAASSMK